MKRKFVILLMIWLAFILQTSVFKMITAITVSPNLLLIITVAIAFMQGKKEGMITGFVCGLFIDLNCGYLCGFHALIYLLIGYGCGKFRNIYCDEDIKIPVLLVACSDLFYNVAVYIGQFLMRGKLAFGSYFRAVILPETVWTVLIALVFYRLIYLINHRLVEKEKEGRQSLWIRD